MALSVDKYHERAISAQAHIEEKLEVTMKSLSVPTKVGSITSLEPYELGSSLYDSPRSCLNKATVLLGRGQRCTTHEQTLRSTADMSSHIVYRMHDLMQARYLAHKAQRLSKIAGKEQASQILFKITLDFKECLTAIKEIAENIKPLTQKLQRPLTPETTLLTNIALSLRQLDVLYAK